MKKAIIVILSVFISIVTNGQVVECKLKEIELKGSVQVVEYNANFRVYVRGYEGVNTFLVNIVNNPSHCGEWKIVDFNGDFTISIVDNPAQADLEIKLGFSDLNTEFIKKYIWYELK